MTQHDIDALRDAIVQNTADSTAANRLAAAIEVYVAPIAAERDDALRVLTEMGNQLTGTEIDLDAARARADRMHTAWTSARRRAVRYRGLAEIRAAVRTKIENQLDTAIEQRDQAREKATRLRRERDELRRALRSAMSSPDEPGVHTTLSHMRRLAGLDEAPTRPDLANLPEEDLVEPGDEVPTLAEMHDRVAALEASRADEAHELATVLRGVVDGALARIAALEASKQQPPAPARYRDHVGDMWEPGPDGWHLWGGGPARSLDYLRDRYAPLTLVADAPAGGAE